MLKYVLAGSLMVAFAVPAVAADEYYIVRGPDKKCTVVDTKPTTTTTTIVGNGTYKTKTEAEAGMKTTKVCSSD